MIGRLAEIEQIMTWLHRQRHFSRWIGRACDRLCELVDGCPDAIAEVARLRARLEAMLLPPGLTLPAEISAERCVDRRELIRESRVYQSTAGPPRPPPINAESPRADTGALKALNKFVGVDVATDTRENKSNRDFSQPEFFGAGKVCPRRGWR